MKKTLTTLAIILSLSSQAQIAPDKKLHFIAGFAIGGAVNTTTYLITKSRRKAFILGLGASFGAGLAKEIKDEIVYGGFDTMDLLYTMAGGLAVNIPLSAIEGLISKRKINKEI